MPACQASEDYTFQRSAKTSALAEEKGICPEVEVEVEEGARLLYLYGPGASPFPDEVPARQIPPLLKEAYLTLFPDVIFTPSGPAIPIQKPIPKTKLKLKPLQERRGLRERRLHQDKPADGNCLPIRLNEDDLYGPIYEGKTCIPARLLRPRSRRITINYARAAIKAGLIGEASVREAPDPQGGGKILLHRDGVYVPVQVGDRAVWVDVRDRDLDVPASEGTAAGADAGAGCPRRRNQLGVVNG